MPLQTQSINAQTNYGHQPSGIRPPPTLGNSSMTPGGPGIMATSSVNTYGGNIQPPPGNMSSRPANVTSSIRQRYPNMMPPPINTSQQQPMQPPPTMNPSSTPSSTNHTYGQGPTTPGYPTASTQSSLQQPPAGFPPIPTSNSSIGGRPNHGMPPPVLATSALSQRIGGLSLNQGGDAIDLLQNRHILPPRGTKVPVPRPRLQAELWNTYNCSSDVFRSTLTKVQ